MRNNPPRKIVIAKIIHKSSQFSYLGRIFAENEIDFKLQNVIELI